MMATSLGIHDLASCGYCTVKLHKMDDPRMLPCGHVHCSSCMQGNFLGDEETIIVCPVNGCEKEHRDSPMDSLQKVDTTDIDPLTCDKRKCVDEPACNFCVDCGQKLCLSHYRQHEAYFEGEHKVLDIHKYEEAPKKYKKVFCSVHPKEVLIKGCAHCSKPVCSECDRQEGVCAKAPDGSHEYELLEELEREITSQIKEKLRSVENKIGEIKDMDKETWRRLAVVEAECIECKEEIERYRLQQIELINKTCEQMIKKVEGHLKEMSDRVEMFSAHVVDKKESIQDVYRRVKNIINNGHKVDKVTHRHNMADELDKCTDEDVGRYVLTDTHPSITVTSGHSMAELNLVKIPFSLHFSQHDTAGGCYSVAGRENGDLLLGCDVGLQLMKKSTGEITSVDLPFKQVNSVVVLHHVIYILHQVDKTCKVEMILPDLQHQQTLFEFQKEGIYAPSMSVSDRHVVVFYPQAVASDKNSDSDSFHLIIYNFTTAQTENTKIDTNHRPHFLSNGHLLVAANTNIRKVKIEDGQLVTIWTCGGLKDVHRVVSDEQGIIYACTWSDTKLLYIISPEGELLKEISDNRLPSTGGQMYVKDDTLYLPGWADKKLYTCRLIKQ